MKKTENTKDAKDRKDSDKYVVMRVSKEFKELCDEFAKNMQAKTWDAIIFSDADVTRVLAKKAREIGILREM